MNAKLRRLLMTPALAAALLGAGVLGMPGTALADGETSTSSLTCRGGVCAKSDDTSGGETSIVTMTCRSGVCTKNGKNSDGSVEDFTSSSQQTRMEGSTWLENDWDGGLWTEDNTAWQDYDGGLWTEDNTAWQDYDGGLWTEDNTAWQDYDGGLWTGNGWNDEDAAE